MKREEIIQEMLDIVETTLEAVQYLFKYYDEGKFIQFEQMLKDIKSATESFLKIYTSMEEKIKYSTADIACENILYSIENINLLFLVRSDRTMSKIEFELLPLFLELRYDLYYFGFVHGDSVRVKKFYKEEYFDFMSNPYIEDSCKTGEYKYDMSVFIPAYNKLEYTKQCVESVMNNMPKDINYELILFDNGSSDGTKEYFDGLNCTKTLHMKINNLFFLHLTDRIAEGRYFLSVSNDVIITHNAVSNMLKCIKSDELIAKVVPATSNVSNLQAVNGKYESMSELYDFAIKNNVSDSRRWEQRTRLCDPICLSKSALVYSSRGVKNQEKFWKDGFFSDDAVALRFRRAGYKLVLAKDAFCHHFGSVTFNEIHKENINVVMLEARRTFYDRYNVDPWGTGFCYDFYMPQMVKLKLNGSVNILGINPGFGSNPLKIKELHRENGNENIIMKFIATTNLYYEDWKAIADESVVVKDTYEIIKTIEKAKYDFICLEDYEVPFTELKKLILVLKETLTVDGTLCLKIENKHIAEISKRLEGAMLSQGDEKWIVWRKESDGGNV